MREAKRTTRRATNCKRCFGSLVLWSALLIAAAPPAGAEGADERAKKSPPKLSLQSLYHPEHQYDYDGQLTSTHWLDDPAPTLIVRRDERWMQVDLPSGREQPWPVQDQLEKQLAALSGVEPEQAAAAALRAAGKLEDSDDSVLVRIGESLAVVSADAPARLLTRDAAAWNNPALDPTGTRLAYTRQGDLFVVDLKTDRTLRLTDDASETLLDGILDWTYQEEIFGRGNYRAFWFSPDGQRLAMLRVDISDLEPYTLTGADAERGAALERRYSKAGDPIPHAELLLWDLTQLAAGEVPSPRSIDGSTAEAERIITGVWWHPYQQRLLYSISDRAQTWRELRYVGPAFFRGQTDEPTRLLREESPAWVEPPADPGWLKDGGLVWRSALPIGRSRLFRVSADGSAVTPLTPADFDVHEFFVAPDGAFGIVTGDAQPPTVQRHAYRIDWRDAAEGQAAELVPITTRAGWHRVQIGPQGKWLVSAHSGLTEPPTLQVQATTAEAKPTVLEETSLTLPGELTEPKLVQIPAAGGIGLPAILIQPPSASAERPCPVVVEVYGGPGAALVADRWAGTRALYRELLARRGIGTLVVDNRSSAGRGMADTWSIYRRFGQVELKDLLAAVEWLGQREWVDADRLAIRGWSFGGFLTLYAMTHSEAFAAGIAGGSVADWREYDSFYTERYMGLPSENEQGYRAASPIEAAENLHGRLLMIHGELDDNVHPANTLRMAAALQRAGKPFQLMIYPGASHGVHRPWPLWHLKQMTHRFLISTLEPNR